MSGDSDLMRILGNIEGKLDGIVETQTKAIQRIDTLHIDLQAHKEDDARIHNRVIGVMTTLGAILSTAWALITFFGASIARAFNP